ncbi:MAG: glycosyltransferase family 4 protein [Acidimicrobiales bacterium]|jgi:glycosyltransferase involved in cell wall biosynthesis|nr:glycosyltransferase family 4 protein [Acidimicrobiales bacterium]
MGQTSSDAAAALAGLGLPELVDVARHVGLQRIHVLAWRDLADPEAGGSETHLHEIMARWAGAGLEVLERTSYAAGHPSFEERAGYRIVRKRGRYVVFPAAVYSELRHRYGPRDGLVEVWNGVPFLSPVWARGPRVVLLHHVHRDMWGPALGDPRLAAAGRLLETRLAPPFYRRTPVVTLSSSSKRQIVEWLGIPEHQVRVVPPGIDARFSVGGAKSSRPLLLHVGRLMPSKRVDGLLRAVHAVHRAEPDVQLVVIGEGTERPALEQMATELGDGDWVRFLGRVGDDELVPWYRTAWLVVNASSAEGWGMTLTEAAACGTPAVATDIAGHADAVIDGESGLLVPEPADLTDAVLRVLRDGELRTRLSEGALKRAVSLRWDETAAGVLRPLVAQAVQRAGVRIDPAG